MIGADFKVDQRFKRSVQSTYQGYVFEAGILKDKAYRLPRKPRQLTGFRGGPARKTSGKTRGRVSQVSELMRKRFKIYEAPFKKKKSRDMVALIKAVGEFLSSKKKDPKRVDRAMINAIINPILQGKYGRNRRSTAKAKGFNRLMIDTAQMVKSITARTTKRRQTGKR